MLALRRCHGGLGLVAGVLCALAAAPVGSAAPGSRAPKAAYRPAASSTAAWRSATPAPVSAARTAPRGVNYGGTTAQLDPFVIALSKNGRSVARIREEWEATCADGHHYLFSSNAKGPLPISASGAFGGSRTAAQTLGPGLSGLISETIAGKVKGKKITGVLTPHVDVVDDASGTLVTSCDLTTRYSLVSAKGREYAGGTSQGEPAVVELTASRKRVNHFHIGWAAGCSPTGTIQFGEFLRNFPLRSGRFGDTWSQLHTEPTGEFETQDFAVHGKVKRAKASGTFRTALSFHEGSGATVATCDSGPISWSATSG